MYWQDATRRPADGPRQPTLRSELFNPQICPPAPGRTRSSQNCIATLFPIHNCTRLHAGVNLDEGSIQSPSRRAMISQTMRESTASPRFMLWAQGKKGAGAVISSVGSFPRKTRLQRWLGIDRKKRRVVYSQVYDTAEISSLNKPHREHRAGNRSFGPPRAASSLSFGDCRSFGSDQSESARSGVSAFFGSCRIRRGVPGARSLFRSARGGSG